MILRNTDYQTLANEIKYRKKKIIVYGAGMIGQIIIPFLATKYNLIDYIDCFVDMDNKKQNTTVTIGKMSVSIRNTDYLKNVDSSYYILITNSKFFSVVEFLDEMVNLKDTECFIVPIMQIFEAEKKRDSIKITDKNIELIPRKIHYCWFGRKEKTDFIKKCIYSWKELCPDYEVIEWNEDNYDVNKHLFTKEAYEKKRFGFVSDMARLDILYDNGGVYFDTDVRLIKNIDSLLSNEGFIGVEKWGNINSGGGCGFVKGHPLLKKIIDYRDNFSFVLEDKSLNVETNGKYETSVFLQEGFIPNNTLQCVLGVRIYPYSVFHPYDYMSCYTDICEDTVSIHYFYGGWMEEKDRQNREKTQKKYQEIINRMSN